MGNSSTSSLHGTAKLAANRFDSDEIVVLQKTWQDLAERTNGKGIDKETFLQYFPLNGLLGERLFAQFDTKGNGYIDFEEFILGLSIACRGTLDEKIHFIFNMYNVSHDNKVSKQELATLLNHIPKEILHSHDHDLPVYPSNYSSNYSSNYPPNGLNRNISTSNMSINNDGNESDVSNNTSEPDYDKEGDDVEEVDNYTNHDLVEKAFQECDINHEGRLSYEEFKMWIERNPALLEHIESILPYNGPKDIAPHHDKRETLPRMKRISRASLSRSTSYSQQPIIQDDSPGLFSNSQRKSSITKTSSFLMGRQRASTTQQDNLMLSQASFHVSSSPSPRSTTPQPFDNQLDKSMDSDEQVRLLLIQAFELTHNETLKKQIASLVETLPGGLIVDNNNLVPIDRQAEESFHLTLESFLWKRGKSLHLLSKRYYLLSGNCLFYYASEKDVRPKGVIFLTGSIVERLHEQEMALKGYYGFELLHQDLGGDHHGRHDKRVLYCKSELDRDTWVTALQHAAQVIPIEDDYVMGKELGRGRFSVVCECVHKLTNRHCAVKIIDKATIEPEEKQLLRTEIAVLKLVNHPNIIRLEGIYESKAHIYIVMEMLQGGELFQRIVGRPRFSEAEAAKIIRPLLESVAYLHDLGIVHRDIKPENILCGAELEDLKIADFGLSKMILPKEKMDNACGTLSYVAPEVLTMQGYGKEADLWSVGVIMFLLLCGKLPFDGDDHNEIIRNTIQGDLKVNPTIWTKLSDDAKSLMTSLLNKSPKDRITAREALKHPFILKFAPHKRSHHKDSISSQGPIVAPAIHSSTYQTTGDSSPGHITNRTSSIPDSVVSSFSESEASIDISR